MSKPEDLNFFNDLLTDMDSLDSGGATVTSPSKVTSDTFSTGVNQNHFREMYAIAQSIDDLIPSEKPDYKQFVTESFDTDIETYDSGAFRAEPETRIIERHIPISFVTFEVIHTPVNGLKSLTNYSVVVKETSQPIISNIYLKECAYVVADFLNKGKTLSDVKILGILGSAIQYTNIMTEAYTVSKKRQAVLRESKYDLAKGYDEDLKKLSENANVIKEKVLKFLKEQGYV